MSYTNRIYLRFGPVLVSVLLAVTCTGAQPSIGEKWSDWPSVEVPEEPPSVQTVRTEILWRLDCSTNAEVLVGRIVAAAPGLDGRTLLLDGQMQRVLVMSRTGLLERAFGQRGEGPGDLPPGCYRLFGLLDGRIGVCGGGPAMVVHPRATGKIVLLDQADQPAGLWYGAGDPGSAPASSIRDLRCSNDNILVSSYSMVFKEASLSNRQQLAFINSVNGDRTVIGSREFEVKTREMRFEESDYFEPFAYGRCDISSIGQIAFAPLRDRWLVAIRSKVGKGLVLDRQWTQVKRTEGQKEAVWKALGGHDGCVALDSEPAIGLIRWRPDGKLWVEPFGIDPGDGAIACFDEFDSSGALIRRVRLEIPDLQDTDELVVMENGRIVVLRGFGDDTDVVDPVDPEVLFFAIEGNADSN